MPICVTRSDCAESAAWHGSEATSGKGFFGSSYPCSARVNVCRRVGGSPPKGHCSDVENARRSGGIGAARYRQLEIGCAVMPASLSRYLAALSRSQGESLSSRARRAWAALLARIYLRKCTRVGFGARTYGRPRIINEGTLAIGERLQLYSNTACTELAVGPGATLEIGDRCFINYGTSIGATGSVRIGNDCLIGTYVMILDNDFHDLKRRDVRPPSRPVLLEDEVWLANRVIVLPGVTIGRGAAVGAGSVVVRDVPPRSLAVGNPARVCKTF